MTERYRPNFHFSPKAGWMNDPNGLIKVDGTYHLFFQHDPDSVLHGPMHWGHATSQDLLSWTEQPVALSPNALGTCFSGSAVETINGEMKLFYTAHSTSADGLDHQVQCLVHADRSLSRFEFDPRNPVVPNPGLEAFRDPKVIWHRPTERWIMLVTEGQSIGFFASTDLVQWTHLSSFGEGHGRHSSGPWECPDLVPLAAPGGEVAWVLIVGLNPGAYGAGSGTQYFIGQFDGVRFTNSSPPEAELWLDYGRDYYAAQTVFDREGSGNPIAIAWAGNWLYAKQTPTTAFRGVMSLPRELFLRQTERGLRVGMRVPATVRQRLETTATAQSGLFEFEADLAVGEQLALALFGEVTPQFTIRRVHENRGHIRTRRQDAHGMDRFGHGYDVEVEWPLGRPLGVNVVFDRGLVELSTADGLTWITNTFYPETLEARPRIEGPAVA